MASQEEIAERRLIEKIEDRLRDPLVHVSLTWLVYGRSEDGESPEFLREVPDLHVIIDRESGERIVWRHDELDEDFHRLAGDAEHIPCRYTVHEGQLELIQDETHRVIGAFGSQRGGKSQAAALWTFRQWALKGGRGVVGWWIGPSHKLAQAIGVGKLVVGEDEEPAIFPPELVVRYPKKETDKDRHVVLIDGTSIRVDFASERGKGGNLKGTGPRWVVLDEACEMEDIAIWRIVRGRVLKRGGLINQIFMPSTPMPGHWAYSEVVVPVEAGRKPNYTFASLSMVDNVWVPLSEVEQAIEDMGGPDDPVCQREVFGRWTAAGNSLWYAFRPELHIKPAAEVEGEDVTELAIQVAFPGTEARKDRVAGQDFNLYPCTTVIARVVLPPGAPDHPAHYAVVVTDEFVTDGQGTEVHGHLLADQFPDLAIACDPSGAQEGVTKVKANESTTHAKDLAASGHDVRSCHYSYNGLPYHPPQIDSIRLVNHLFRHARLVVDPKCRALIKSLIQQIATQKGTKYAPPGSKHDKLASSTDALRYLVWALFGDVEAPRGKSREQAAEAKPAAPAVEAHVEAGNPYVQF